MNNISFSLKSSLNYHWCGRFVAPDASWMHMSRVLSDYELIIMIEGTLSIAGLYALPGSGSDSTPAEESFTVHTGEYLLMPPTERQYGVKSSYCSFYWMHFSRSEAEKVSNKSDSLNTSESPSFSDENIKIPCQGTLRSIDRVILLLKQLQDSDRRYRNSLLNNSLTCAILAEISLQMTAGSEVEQARYREQICHDITDYISWHLAEPLRCSQIAEYFGYNEKYLTTFFRRNFGISLKNYIIREKMEHAKVILTESNTAVSELAFSLGFNDVHNFSNAFRNSVGLSPTEYRQVYSKHNVFPV